MPKKYKAVVIGCGRIGAEEGLYRKEVQPGTHAAAFSEHPRIVLAGLSDMNEEKLAAAGKRFKGAALFETAEKMLKEVKPDIVSVATPVDSHLAMVRLAAEYGARAIVCEKPIAPTIAQAEEMIAVCKKQRSLLFVNHTRRFDPLLNRTRELVRAGKFGKIMQATSYYYNGILNNGTHLIDLLRFFLGDVDWVVSRENKETKNPKLTQDLNVDGLLHFKNGALSTLQSLPANYVFFEFYFYGTEGAFFLRDSCYKAEYRKLIPHRYYKGYYQLEMTAKAQGKMRSFMGSMAGHIVKCLDGTAKQASRGEDGLSALKVISALKESAKHIGRIIKLD